jgi:hypothetical protein
LDVRIGVFQTPREIEVEMGDDADPEALSSEIEAALGNSNGVLQLTDRRGRRYMVPTSKVAYVEVGSAGEDRRVGFGAP